MAARTTTLPQQRAQETRQRLLDAAERVFARHGFAQGTVDLIADEAGVSMGALYHHFSGKEELFRALLATHIDRARLQLSSLAGATSLRDAVGRFIDFWIDHLRTDLQFGDLLLEFLAQASRESWAQEAIDGFFRRGYELIAEALRMGQAAHAIRDDLDARAAGMLVFALAEGVCVMHAISPRAIDLTALREPWIDLVVRYIEGGDQQSNFDALRDQLGTLLQPASEEPAP
jgi:AcrR family transcriptional regulator